MLKWPDLTQVKPTMEVGGSNPSWGGFNSEQGAATPKVGSLNLEEFNQSEDLNLDGSSSQSGELRRTAQK